MCWEPTTCFLRYEKLRAQKEAEEEVKRKEEEDKSNMFLILIFLTLDFQSILPKLHFLDILEVFSLDMSQIDYNVLKKVFATWQHTFPP